MKDKNLPIKLVLQKSSDIQKNQGDGRRWLENQDRYESKEWLYCPTTRVCTHRDD